MTDHCRYTIIKADNFSPFRDDPANRYLLLNNGIIESISEGLPASHRMSYLDFTGCVITPFLCDYHLHFPSKALASSEKIADSLLRNGIGKVLEGGDGGLSGIQMKGLLNDRIEVQTAGCAIYKKGGYGKFIGKAVEDFREAKALIDELCELGADYIKVINSGIFEPETAGVTSGGFERGELAGIVGFAKERGLDVFCHANGDNRIRDAVHAGVSAIIHGLQVSDETLSLMADKQIAFIPTANAFCGLSALTGSPVAKTNIGRAVEGHLLAVKEASDRGVKVLPGSDSGPQFLPYGKAYHEELALFSKAGLTDGYILSSAVADRLMPGMKADFLVMKGLGIEKIFLGGNVLERQ